MRFRLLASLVVAALPVLVQAQPLPPMFDNNALKKYEIPSCQAIGCNRQVVEPNRALERWGTNYGESGKWIERVRKEPLYRADGDEDKTCSGAIRALFMFACDNTKDCEIEDRYKEKCLSSTRTEQTAEACVRTVKAYAQQCFGSGCPRELEDKGLVGGVLLKNKDEAYCSGAGLLLPSSSNNSFAIRAVATVKHCQPNGGGINITGYGPHKQFTLSGKVEAPYANQVASTEILAYDASSVYVPDSLYPLPVGHPKLFEKTYFQGYNSLIASYNKVVPNVTGATALRTLMCDRSELCTIVKVDGDKLWHTCQSTKGGSGGVLVQEIKNKRFIVGLNNGSPSKGEVTENDGFRILK